MRANRVTSSPVRGRTAPAVVLAVLASLALLVLGLAEPAASDPGSSDARTAALSAAAPAGQPDPGTDPRGGTSMDGPESSLLVRAAGPAAAPAPAAPVAGVGAGSHPLVAAHLLGQPQARPPTRRPEAHPARAHGSRAPPGPAGT